MAYEYDYPKVSVTSTVFGFYRGKLLAGERAEHSEIYPGYLCVPGGFLNAYYKIFDNVIHKGETAKETAVREYKEETNIDISVDDLIIFHEDSHPLTDKRCHVVNLCYIVNLTEEQYCTPKAGDDLSELGLMTEFDTHWYAEHWAFNHAKLAKIAFALRNNNEYFRKIRIV